MIICIECHKEIIGNVLDGHDHNRLYHPKCRRIAERRREKERRPKVAPKVPHWEQFFISDEEWYKSDRYKELATQGRKYNPKGMNNQSKKHKLEVK